MAVPDDFLDGFFKQHPDAQSGKLTMQELNNLMAAYQQQMNERPLADFDGLNPAQMEVLLHEPLGASSLLQLRKDMELHVDQIPIYKLSELLIAEIKQAGTLKLTVSGNLPVRVCTLLYKQHLIGSDFQLNSDRIREDEVNYLWPLKQYLVDTGIAKKRNNAMSLTRQGEIFVKAAKADRFTALLKYFTTRFHWGNFYPLEDMGNTGYIGWAYSLVLLSRYGSKARPSAFYSTKLIQAFEQEILNTLEDYQYTLSDYHYAYAVRFFDCFTNWFGLVKIERTRNYSLPAPERLSVSKSDLFDQIFQVHQT